MRQTLDGRSGRLLTHSSYTTPRDTTPSCMQLTFKTVMVSC